VTDDTGRDIYRVMTATAVLLVAAIAAVVSYIHIARLALAYGQEPLAAYMLPPSIDGVVATSSLVMFRAARAGVSSPWLARLGLGLSVAATLAANVASGLGHGWRGAVLAGWPPSDSSCRLRPRYQCRGAARRATARRLTRHDRRRRPPVSARRPASDIYASPTPAWRRGRWPSWRDSPTCLALSLAGSKRDLVRVGDRDGWVCGICRDPARPVNRPPLPVQRPPRQS